MDDILALFGDDPAAAQAQAKAMADAMRQRRAAGTLATILGGPFAAAGKTFSGDADALQQQLVSSGQQRAGLGLQRQRLTQEGDQQKATEAYRTAQLGLDRERLNLDRSRVDQDAWGAVADPVTGGIVMFNKKTGEVKPLGPGGGRPGPGLVSPKPKDLENDVQALGKDLEPIQKAVPDIATLRSATSKDDVAGFGPIAGRVPDMLASSDGVANRQAAGRLMAAIIQATSGQAASEKEVARLLEANGMGRTATTEQLRQGVEKLAAQYDALLKQREAKYHPDVVKTYRSRGGYTMPGAAEPGGTDDALRKKYGL
jgi:hypothetical protein